MRQHVADRVLLSRVIVPGMIRLVGGTSCRASRVEAGHTVNVYRVDVMDRTAVHGKTFGRRSTGAS